MNTTRNTCYLCGRTMDMRYTTTNCQNNNGQHYHYVCEAEEYMADCEGREPNYEVVN